MARSPEAHPTRENVLFCRALTHEWETYNSDLAKRPFTGMYIFQRCPRCFTEKRLHWDKFGQTITKPRYDYPIEYKEIGQEFNGVGKQPYRAEIFAFLKRTPV